MKTPLIRRIRTTHANRERGVTMVLVALAMVAIIGMAALSIDVITLYLAKQDVQRSADDAALAAAKIISLSGITGDPTNSRLNWGVICGGTSSMATRTAKAVADQNLLSGPALTPTVTYSSGGTSNADCAALSSTRFGVNPMVTVQLQRNNLPTFFSRIWGNTGNNISATATAEVFNPSNSDSVASQMIPVQPRCIKPWIVPNQDPLNPGGTPPCNQSGSPCQPIVSLSDGSINNPGISLGGATGGSTGIIGETFWLASDCDPPQSTCSLQANPPRANIGSTPVGFPNLSYVPGQVGTPVTAVPSCATGNDFEEAVGGCDAPTNYTCGLPPGSGGTNVIDLSNNRRNETRNGASCLIHEASGWDTTEPSGQDYFNAFMAPSSYPFQIFAGSGTATLTGLPNGSAISMSSSIVSLPIYKEGPGVTLVNGNANNPVTFVGFLQVFINAVDQFGNISVTVLNVAGCGDGTVTPGPAITANSPVPVRLITPP
jgi:hypothetical protein